MKMTFILIVGLGLVALGVTAEAKKPRSNQKRLQQISNCIEANPKSEEAQFKCINTDGTLSLVQYKHCSGMCTAANASCISSCLDK